MAYKAIQRLVQLHRRMLGVYFALIGKRWAYAVTGALARTMYALLSPLRARSEAQCRAALAGSENNDDVPRIARESFVHRTWNLTDLILAERLLHPGVRDRYGGLVPQPFLARMARRQDAGLPMLLVTAYYGPFDLLPVFLGFSGIRASVAYRPHADVSFDVFRRTIRRLGGCQLIPVDETPWRISDELAAGRTVAVLSDHHASDRGVPATFLGLETRVPRSIGLLAKRYDAAVAVAGIRRIGCGFRFEIVVTDVIEPSDWRCRPDEVEYITNRYLRGLERLIMGDPTQYLWARARWGEETAVRLVEEDLRSRAIADMKSSTR